MPCTKGCLISKVCADAYSGTKQPPCATELVVPSQQADNNARDEICPACHGTKFINLDPCTVSQFLCVLCGGRGKLSPVA